MSPRPRKATDEQIFAAAHRVMSRLGAAQWTLADIAAEAGLTAGALVQRFGSKHQLMVTLMGQFAEGVPQMFAELRAASSSPLGALRAYADCIAQMGEAPGGLAHHLGYLQLDLSDPDMHRHLRAQARASRKAIRGLLDDAVAAGELRLRTDTAALARAVEVVVSGSLMVWAFHQEGSATASVRHDLDALLEPYLAAARRRAHAPRRGRKRALRR